jgi:hypothetical protein
MKLMPKIYGKKDPLPLPSEPTKCDNCEILVHTVDWVYMGRWGNREVWWECRKCNKLTIEPSDV